MSKSSVLVRERKRRSWVIVGRAVTTAFWTFSVVCALCIPAGLVIVGAGVRGHILNLVLVVSVVCALGAILMPVMRRKVMARTDAYIDQRFASRAYPMVIRSLRRMKIADPAVFIDERPTFVEAYIAVKHAALNVLDSHYSRMDGSRVTAVRIHDEAHRIAMLIFPGQDEIAREQRIIYFLENRDVTDYATLVEMLNETDEHPLPLLEGAL